MAASVTMILDAAAKQSGQSEGAAEPLVGEGVGSTIEASSDLPQREGRSVESVPVADTKVEEGADSMAISTTLSAAPKTEEDSPSRDSPLEVVTKTSTEMTQLVDDMSRSDENVPQAEEVGHLPVKDQSDSPKAIPDSTRAMSDSAKKRLDPTTELLDAPCELLSSQNEVPGSTKEGTDSAKTKDMQGPPKETPELPAISGSAVTDPINHQPDSTREKISLAEHPPQTTTSTNQAIPVKKSTPKGTKSKSANALGIIGPKKKKKKSPEASHPSVGISVDALDKDKRWGHGRIIEVNVTEQRLKITFPGYSKKWDIWTDMLSIAPHGRHSEQARLNSRSWDGRTNLFTGELMNSGESDDVCGSPNRLEISPIREHAIAPVKPPRRVKKGYILVPVPEDATATPDCTVLKGEKSPPKRKLSSPGSKLNKRSRHSLHDGLQPSRGLALNDPYTNVELGEQRALNESLLQRSSAFLAQCAETWKRQLLGMTQPQQAAFLGGETGSEVLTGLI